MQTYFLLGGREVAEIFEMKDSCLPVVENRGTPHSQDPQTHLICQWSALGTHNTLQSKNADSESRAAFLTLTFLPSQRMTAFPRPALSRLP